MIKTKAKIDDKMPALARVAKKNNIATLGQAGAFVRQVMRRSIRKSKRAALPGQPVKTRKGAIRQAILFSVEKDRERVLIGPAASRIGANVGGAHEFGGSFRGRKYPARPFAGPAIVAAAPRLPSKWDGLLRG